MDARGKEKRKQGERSKKINPVFVGEKSRKMCFLGFLQYGIPGPCTELFAGVGTYCVGFVLQGIRYVLECTSGC